MKPIRVALGELSQADRFLSVLPSLRLLLPTLGWSPTLYNSFSAVLENNGA